MFRTLIPVNKEAAMRWSDLRDWFRARPGYWFRPKLYGYGATPVIWQGWAVTAGFVAAIGALAGAGDPILLLFTPPLALGLVLIARRKTDGAWRWRWGFER